MKKLIYSIFAAAALLPVSCSEDTTGVGGDTTGEPSAVIFSAAGINEMTKASGTSWEDGDEIGIYKFNSNDQVVSDNVCYQLDSNGSAGTFTAVDSDNEIYYSEDGAAVDFWAYYPYQEDYDYDTPTFSIADQDGTTTAKADYMEAVKLTNQTSGEQTFTFSHKFSQVVISITYGSELENLDDLEVEIDGISTEIDLTYFSATDDATKSINATLSSSNSVATAVVLPVATDAVVKLYAGGNEYQATLEQTFAAGKQYSYDVCIGVPDMPVTLTSTGIDQWGTGADDAVASSAMVYNNGVYEIYSAAGLQAFAALVNGGDTAINGELMNDIDLSEVCGEDKGSWIGIGSYSPSKIPYKGIFNGNGYAVDNLYVTGVTSSCAGLFPYTVGATIQNIAVKNASVTSNAGYAGRLIGYSSGSYVTGCSVIGGTVTGTKQVGGVVGSSEGGSIVASCYSTATATGTSDAAYAASVLGYNSASSLYFSYGKDSTIGTSYNAGDEVGNATKSESEMMDESFVTLLNEGVDSFNEDYVLELKAYGWSYNSGDYPTINMDDVYVPDADVEVDIEIVEGVYQIHTAAGLQTFSSLVSAGQSSIDGKLMKDIDLAEVCGEDVASWTEIGTYSPKIAYTGTFDGCGYTVENPYISGATTSCKGLFGYTSGATIMNVTVKDADITSSSSHVGGLIGYANSTHIFGCAVIGGSMTGSKQVGGLVGSHETTCVTTGCYSTATVTGDTTYSAGLIGYNKNSIVQSSYSVVSAVGITTSPVGNNNGTTTVENCEIKTTTEMQEEAFVTLLNAGVTYYNTNYTSIATAWTYNAGDYPSITK